MKVRKNDNVMVISGNARGKTGKVLKVIPASRRVIVEGVNIVKRHTRRTQKNPQGGIIQKEAPIHISNVMVICPKCDTPTRLGGKHVSDVTTGRKQRVRICRNPDCRKMF